MNILISWSLYFCISFWSVYLFSLIVSHSYFNSCCRFAKEASACESFFFKYFKHNWQTFKITIQNIDFEITFLNLGVNSLVSYTFNCALHEWTFLDINVCLMSHLGFPYLPPVLFIVFFFNNSSSADLIACLNYSNDFFRVHIFVIFINFASNFNVRKLYIVFSLNS
jgi:hypothetical protein